LRKKTLVITISVLVLGGLVAILAFGTSYAQDDEDTVVIQEMEVNPDTKEMLTIETKEGDQSLILKSSKNEGAKILMTAKEGEKLHDPQFLSNGKEVSVIGVWGEQSKVYSISLNASSVETLYEDDDPITEVEVDQQYIYMVKGEFQHDDQEGNPFHYYDLYRLDRKTNEVKRLTDVETLSAYSLIHGEKNNKLYFIMSNSFEVDLFDSKQKIYELSLDEGSEFQEVEVGQWNGDAFHLSLSPDEKSLAFISIGNPDSGETFHYELYHLSLASSEVKRLTYLEGFVAEPSFVEEDRIYYLFSQKLTNRYKNMDLFEINLNNKESTKIPSINKDQK
jgi:Tol biopolymer transport system component